MKNLMLAGAISLALVFPAFAGSVRIDFTQPVFVEGKPFIDDQKCPLKTDKDDPKREPKRECETPMTLGELCFLFLERPFEHQTWTEALKRDDLARAIRSAKDFPLLDDQRAMIETAIGPVLPPVTLGVIAGMIDPKSAASTK